MVSLAVELSKNTRLTDSMPGLFRSYSLRKFPLVRRFLPHPGKVACGWRFSVLVLALALAGAAQAQSFSVLLERARSGEPTYLGAKTNVLAAQARNSQAIGAMLPQVSATASSNDNDRKYKTRNSSVPEARDQYDSYSAQISLTQPLLRYANIVGWRQARAVVGQAEHQLAGAEQELFAKLVGAWFDLLAARDAVAFTGRQADALQRQWEIVSRGGELGVYGQPQVDEARTKLDQALSDAVVAETDVHLKRAALEQLVGTLPERELPYMVGEAVLASPTSDSLEKWLENVETGNPNILAATQAFEAALAEVSKQRAGHFPTLDLVASYGKNGQAVGGFPGQAGYDIVQGTLGLQLNVPLFSGGAQSAKVDEALAQKEKARLDLEVARRTAILNTKQAWFGWHGAFARTRAGNQAVKSARSALAQAKAGAENGLKTELDVLQAEQQLRAGQRDFRKGRYDQVVTFIRLLAVSGRLTDGDVAALDSLLVESPEAAEPPVEARMIKVSGR
ncbi:MAG: type I secretion protein TolC [Betaproteobacteria bacterium HGW-Betaproteobacteria-4]|nr:MAG: type I secretion protein TolC [Betaproteobacteria bacterium HGW-Betaproteobacteria-4]